VGVNALTGDLLQTTYTPDPGLQYDDIDGNPYKQMINKLALYGVACPGGFVQAGRAADPSDALILLAE
jgi:hypothetical protein